MTTTTRPANRWNDPGFIRVFNERTKARADWYKARAALDTPTLHAASDGRGNIDRPDALPADARAAYDRWLAADAAYVEYAGSMPPSA